MNTMGAAVPQHARRHAFVRCCVGHHSRSHGPASRHLLAEDDGMASPADALAAGPLVLDGGLSTELEAQGYDISSALWSARLLRDDPGAIVAACLPPIPHASGP